MNGWQTGKPTKDGHYAVVYRARQWEPAVHSIDMEDLIGGDWKYYHEDEVLAWMELPPWESDA